MLTTVTEDSHQISIGPATAAARRRTSLITLAKVAVTALAIAFVACTVDLSAAWKRTLQQDFWLAVLAAGLVLAQIALGAARWQAILRQLGARLGFSNTLRLFAIGAFFNVYLWGAVAGDALRGWLVYRRGPAPRSRSIPWCSTVWRQSRRRPCWCCSPRRCSARAPARSSPRRSPRRPRVCSPASWRRGRSGACRSTGSAARRRAASRR
jgi:hypothetical protein